MELIGSIVNQGTLQGQINDANGYLTGVISNAGLLGGQVVAERGLQGEKGDTGDTGETGADGFSPSASVSKVGHTATITITDKDGTTTAEVYDGSGGGASAFIAEFGVTTYADVKDAYDEDSIILCTVDDSGNTVICQLAYHDDANGIFYFAQPQSDGFYLAFIGSDDTWDDSYFQFASTDTATQLRNGLMDALDKQKLDGIASGAEVNVQSDWDEADSTDDAYIKNKPTIPTVNDATLTIQKNGTTVNTFTANASSNVTANITVPTDTGDLTNGAGFITGVTSTSTPTASTIAEFDNDAHMNSTDMTTGIGGEVEDFVSNLNIASSTSNDIAIAGNFYAENHSSPIGWYDTHYNTTSISNGSGWQKVSTSSISLSTGRYLLVGCAIFASNNSGIRGIAFGDSSSQFGTGRTVVSATPSGWSTQINVTHFIVVNGSTDVYLYVMQNSGSTLSVEWDIKAIRIR